MLTNKSLAKSFNFLKKLTTQVGVIQHTKYGLPDRKEGYALDDNARALIVAIAWFKMTKEKKALDMARVYLAWLVHAKTDEGFFHNFASFDNQFKRAFSEDGFGRAFWALGYCFHAKVRDELTFPAKTIIDEVAHNLTYLRSPRAIAYSLLGLFYLAKSEPEKEEWREKTRILADRLVLLFKKSSNKDWPWFEAYLTYSNHILPLALLRSFSILGNTEYKEIAIKSLDFLEEASRIGGVPSPVGSNGWFSKGKKRAVYDQQPIEASEAALANFAAFRVTKVAKYRKSTQEWAAWYFGNNVQKKDMVDEYTGGCYDALMETGVNKNQGAESIIAFLMTQLLLINRLQPVEATN